MNLLEARELLVLIESYDRRPFRPEAVDLWFNALRSVAAEDATAAVHQIFRISGHDKDGNIRKLLPHDVVRPAQAIGEARRRKLAQAAISAPPQRVGSTGRPAEVERMLAEARAKAEAAAQRYREPVAA
jgi:hypothetical protein